MKGEQTMETNKFELIGRVSFIEDKQSASGIRYVRILLSRKAKQDTYESFPIVFFDETAKKFAGTIRKGDYIDVTGNMRIDTYVNADNKKTESIKLYAQDFVKVTFDTGNKRYVPANSVSTNTGASQEQLPW